MRSLLVIVGTLLFAMLLTAHAQAQEANCLACYTDLYLSNSFCESYNGSWPNCRTDCSGGHCSCKRDPGGRCARGTDGTYHFMRIREVLHLPADQPFRSAYRVARARMSQQRNG
jgi:hypothetical protein